MTELDDGTVVLVMHSDDRTRSEIKRYNMQKSELLDSTEVFQVGGLAKVNLGSSVVLAISNK